MEQERCVRWVQASLVLKMIEPFMIPVAQGLGRLDVKLILDDKRFSELPQTAQGSIDESIELTDRFTYSYLWILGAYELVRALDQRCRDNPSLLGQQLSKQINTLKHSFERLRIPLAKMEPARSHQDTDAPIAYPAIHRQLGISWQVSRDVFISRREMSDALLALLEEVASTLKSCEG